MSTCEHARADLMDDKMLQCRGCRLRWANATDWAITFAATAGAVPATVQSRTIESVMGATKAWELRVKGGKS